MTLFLHSPFCHRQIVYSYCFLDFDLCRQSLWWGIVMLEHFHAAHPIVHNAPLRSHHFPPHSISYCIGSFISMMPVYLLFYVSLPSLSTCDGWLSQKLLQSLDKLYKFWCLFKRIKHIAVMLHQLCLCAPSEHKTMFARFE